MSSCAVHAHGHAGSGVGRWRSRSGVVAGSVAALDGEWTEVIVLAALLDLKRVIVAILKADGRSPEELAAGGGCCQSGDSLEVLRGALAQQNSDRGGVILRRVTDGCHSLVSALLPRNHVRRFSLCSWPSVTVCGTSVKVSVVDCAAARAESPAKMIAFANIVIVLESNLLNNVVNGDLAARVLSQVEKRSRQLLANDVSWNATRCLRCQRQRNANGQKTRVM